MSSIQITDLAYVRFGASDLVRMREFLLHFGLVDSEPWRDGILRMRGLGSSPYIHVTEPAGNGFLGLALRAGSVADLEKFAAPRNLQISEVAAPGGGVKVRLVDPNGFTVEVIAGQARADSQSVESQDGWNCAGRQLRTGKPKRVPAGPSPVLRLGHVVMLVDDLLSTWEWWRDHFKLLISDQVQDPTGTPAALFLRFDRGDVPVDHHALNIATVPGKGAQFHHAAFEVTDLDSLMSGHDHLVKQNYAHSWGIGRHILGSQVFDYWLDPFGNRVEHWTDGDVFTADAAPVITDLETMLGRQWGPAAPPTFV